MIGFPGKPVGIGTVDRDQLPKLTQSERKARFPVDLRGVDVQLVHKDIDELGRRVGSDLEAYDVTETPAQQFGLHSFEQIIRIP